MNLDKLKLTRATNNQEIIEKHNRLVKLVEGQSELISRMMKVEDDILTAIALIQERL